MRVLDLGCGNGLTPDKLGLPSEWQITGLDVNAISVCEAQVRFPSRPFICAEGERLPFHAHSFDLVICNVALPYMKIRPALNESFRALVPGGRLIASLHPFSFTMRELHAVFPRNMKATVYRLWVIANGFLLYLTGKNIGEAFQTERGMRIALRRAKFHSVSFRRDEKRWWVEATKSE